MMIPQISAKNARESDVTCVQRELRVVRLLFDISQVLHRYLNPEEMMAPVLKLMAEQAGLTRGRVTILSLDTGDIEIDVTSGFSDDGAQARPRDGLYRRIAREVIRAGVPAIVETASEEWCFLDRIPAGKCCTIEHTNVIGFICVPVQGENGTLGAIGVDRFFPQDLSLDEGVQFLTIVAAMLAQTVEIRRELRERERTLEEEKEYLHGEILDHFKPVNIVGNSHAIRQIHQLINQVSSSAARVLITGESGVGKELVAEAIHLNSPRATKPFIKVNLAALPERALESTLFGHERGWCAGGAAPRKGLLEMADGGTLFLDEIGALPMATQVKLLRLLQEKTFARLGGVETFKVDVRIISSTNRNIEEMIRHFQFRLDLYYRLSLFPIFVPPLRERKTDIVLLADFFVERAAKRHGKYIGRISPPAVDMMMNYHWPGNVRELQNCMERAVALCTDGVVLGRHLPPSLQTAEANHAPQRGKLQALLSDLERETIVDALKSVRGDLARAACFLGISERHLRLRMTKHDIHLKHFRPPARSL